VLAELQREWTTLKPQLPHIGKDTDANANLIKVLGLQPTSADYYQRVGYSYDYLRNEQQFAFGGRYGGDVIGMFFERNLARAFLYLMLRYALLHEGTHSIYNLLETAGISAQELVRSRKFMNISTQPDVSHWEVFRAPANRVLPNESSTRSLLSFVQIDRFRPNIGRNIADAKDGLTTLAKLPTARLERLLAEHIDTVNYRLDSWQTALFDLRARAQRNPFG